MNFGLDDTYTVIMLKVVLTALFWSAGIFGVFNFGEVVKEVVAVGLPAPRLLAVATIVIQLGGSLLIITNAANLGWMGAVVLAAFTLATIPLGHAFWTFSEPQRTAELHIALEHITVVGGLLISAVYSKQ